ncbi:MAG: cell division protein FtsQ/DivIB [Holosporales bacterium]|jgi:cell division septal protein FtsQ|nr:cell division protein FtsQ/DivIB [Holosporales bacterium]
MARRSKAKKKQSRSKKFVAIGLIGIAICGGVYFTRDRIATIFWDSVDSTLKIAGFTVKSIDVQLVRDGLEPSDRTVLITHDASKLLKSLGISKGDSIFKISSQQIYENIMADTSIRSAIVRKKLPNVIAITISLKIPIAIFQQGSSLILIDAQGSFIRDVTNNPPNYPLVVGDDANLSAKAILDTISQYEEIRKNLKSLAFIRKRRWNIEVSGLKVKLPEVGVEKALETLTILMRQPNINRKTVRYIDLRVPGSVIINGLKISKKTEKRAIV